MCICLCVVCVCVLYVSVLYIYMCVVPRTLYHNKLLWCREYFVERIYTSLAHYNRTKLKQQNTLQAFINK